MLSLLHTLIHRSDPNYNSYTCGSSLVNYVIYCWMMCFGATTLLFVLLLCRKVRKDAEDTNISVEDGRAATATPLSTKQSDRSHLSLSSETSDNLLGKLSSIIESVQRSHLHLCQNIGDFVSNATLVARHPSISIGLTAR